MATGGQAAPGALLCAASGSGDSSSSLSIWISVPQTIGSIKKRDPKEHAGSMVAWKFVDSRVITISLGSQLTTK